MATRGEVHLGTTAVAKKHFLLASDFDQTLSFNDSGVVLSELIGASDFQAKVEGWPQQPRAPGWGARLPHPPRSEFRGVRKEHLIEAGRRVACATTSPSSWSSSSAGSTTASSRSS
jgi:hypothetical protein